MKPTLKQVTRTSACLLVVVIALLGASPAQQPASYTAQQYQVTLLDPPTRVATANVQRTGNPGAQTFYYWIVTNALTGNSTPAGPFSISLAPNSLNGSNFLSISWAPASNAITYDVLRTTTASTPSGACACAVITGISATTTTDTSNSTGAYTVTSLDPSALGMTMSNESLAAGSSEMRWRSNGTRIFGVSSTGIANTLLGYQINGLAPANHCLVGNGTAYVDSAACGGGSGSPGGVATNLQYQVNATTFGGITNSLVDLSADSSLNNRTMLTLTQTWVNGAANKSQHVLDLNCNSAQAVDDNTLTCAYLTLQNNNTAGIMGHALAGVFRASDNSTGTGTTTDLAAGYFEINTSAGTTSVQPITNVYDVWATNQTLTSGVGRIYTNVYGFKYDGLVFGNTNPRVTNNYGIFLPAIPATGTPQQITTLHNINSGACTDANVFLSGVFCGARLDLQAPVLLQNMTLQATSVAPQTVNQLYAMKFSNFVSDNSTGTNITNLLTGQTGNNGATMIAYDGIVDNGGNSTPTLDAVFRSQLKNSGGGVVTEGVNYLALTPQNSSTYTDTTGFKCNDLTAATQTNTPQCIKQLGASVISTFAGPIYWNGNRVFVSAARTTDGTTNLQAITGLSWTLPLNTAVNVPFSCSLIWHINNAASAVSFGIQGSVAPTNITGFGGIQTATAGSEAWSTLQSLTTTAATAIVSGTPGAISTDYTTHLQGMIEQPAGAASTIAIQFKTATGANTVTVQRGSECVLGSS